MALNNSKVIQLKKLVYVCIFWLRTENGTHLRKSAMRREMRKEDGRGPRELAFNKFRRALVEFDYAGNYV